MKFIDPNDALERGVAAINALTGLDLPRPSRARVPAAGPEDVAAEEVEAAFDLQMAAMFGKADLPKGGFGGISPNDLPIEAIGDMVQSLKDLPDPALVEEAFDTISIRPLGLDDVFKVGGYAYPKLNHGYWELITGRALRRLGLDGLRDIPEFIGADSMFDEFLAVTLRASQARRGEPAGSLMSDRFSLGLGYGNGDRPSTRERYAAGLTPVSRGAMLGALAFLKTATGAEAFQCSDGAFPKRLIWEGTVHAFIERACACSDAIVFIGPPHLSGIRVRDSGIDSFHLMPPQNSVYRQWPAVTAYLIGRLAEIADAFPRVTILAQAAAVTGPLGFLVDMMQPAEDGRELRYFDMGQALDIATLEHAPAGLWLQAQNVAGAFAERPSPLVLERRPG